MTKNYYFVFIATLCLIYTASSGKNVYYDSIEFRDDTHLAPLQSLSEHTRSDDMDLLSNYATFTITDDVFSEWLNGLKATMKWFGIVDFPASAFYVYNLQPDSNVFGSWKFAYVSEGDDFMHIFQMPGSPEEVNNIDQPLADCIYKHIYANSQALKKQCMIVKKISPELKANLHQIFEISYPSMSGVNLSNKNFHLWHQRGPIYQYLQLLDPQGYGDVLKNSSLMDFYQKIFDLLQREMNVSFEGCHWKNLISNVGDFLRIKDNPRKIQDIGGRCPAL